MAKLPGATRTYYIMSSLHAYCLPANQIESTGFLRDANVSSMSNSSKSSKLPLVQVSTFHLLIKSNLGKSLIITYIFICGLKSVLDVFKCEKEKFGSAQSITPSKYSWSSVNCLCFLRSKISFLLANDVSIVLQLKVGTAAGERLLSLVLKRVTAMYGSRVIGLCWIATEEDFERFLILEAEQIHDRQECLVSKRKVIL